MTHLDRPRFDLLREPWIPCERLDGSRVELGFEDTLLRAHDLAGVHDESPLATAMIHRLLLAILHRVVDGPRSFEEWGLLWDQRCFDAGQVGSYLARWRHRFDLFDADRPFLQVPRLAEVLFKERDGKEAEVLPGRRVALECSYYAGATWLLEHGGDEAGLTPAEAARAMLGFQGFGPGGRILNDSGYPKACPLRAGAVVLARGRTLWETLVLNLLVPDRSLPPASPDDAPAWEQAIPAERTKRTVRGWLDALTWQPRRVELLPQVAQGTLLVTGVVTGVGLETQGDWIEPMHALFVRDPKRGAEAVRFDPDRSPWRDATALFQASGVGGEHRRPAVCAQIAALVERDALTRSSLFTIDLYGLASSQAAIGLWRAERMPLPLGLLTDPERLNVVHEALRAADATEAALRGAVWVLARHALASGARGPDKKDIGALVNRLDAKPRYWAALGALFDVFLRNVGDAEDAEAVLVAWKTAAVRGARRALEDAAQQLGTQARALQARALAERYLARELAELSAPPVPTPIQEGASA
jgi:CRISPR system Cascade subunit CasA